LTKFEEDNAVGGETSRATVNSHWERTLKLTKLVASACNLANSRKSFVDTGFTVIFLRLSWFKTPVQVLELLFLRLSQINHTTHVDDIVKVLHHILVVSLFPFSELAFLY
jgi:hypothetical protein